MNEEENTTRMEEIRISTDDVAKETDSSIQYNLESLTDIIRRLKLENREKQTKNVFICQRAKSLNDLNDKNTGYAVFLRPKCGGGDDKPKKLARSNSLRSTIRNRLLQSKHLHASLETSDSHPTLSSDKENAKLVFTSKL